MIALLRGKVAQKELNYVVLDVAGVGYEVLVTPQTNAQLAEGAEATLLIAENIKEDSYTLYGFLDPAERRLYTQLLSVNGVGPKVAMTILASHSSEQLYAAIRQGNVAIFAGVSGIGAKTAQRIVLELKGKIDLSGDVGAASIDPAHQAMVSLGYSAQQASEALRELPNDMPTADKVKAALKGLKR